MSALFAKLPESRPARRRSPAGAAISVAVHAALITLAVVATATTGSGTVPRPQEGTIIWVPPRPPAPPISGGDTREGGTPVGSRTSEQRHGPTAPPLPTLKEPIGGWVPIDTTLPRGIGESWEEGSHPDYKGSGAAGGLSGPDNDGVFTGPQVERMAAMLGTVSPRYPAMLRERGIEGSATLRFVVDTTGRVEPASVKVVSSTHELFAAAARASLASLRFAPAEAGGRRVRQLVELPFSFELR